MQDILHPYLPLYSNHLSLNQCIDNCTHCSYNTTPIQRTLKMSLHSNYFSKHI